MPREVAASSGRYEWTETALGNQQRRSPVPCHDDHGTQVSLHRGTDALTRSNTQAQVTDGLARLLRMLPWMVTGRAREFVGKELAPPEWDPADHDAGGWKQDERGMWWKRSE